MISSSRGTWPSLHYMRLGVVTPVGTDGRSSPPPPPPHHMGRSENREWYVCMCVHVCGAHTVIAYMIVRFAFLYKDHTFVHHLSDVYTRTIYYSVGGVCRNLPGYLPVFVLTQTHPLYEALHSGLMRANPVLLYIHSIAELMYNVVIIYIEHMVQAVLSCACNASLTMQQSKALLAVSQHCCSISIPLSMCWVL